MPAASFADVVSAFGANAKAKLSNPAISGAPEDQLRAPLEAFVKAVAAIGGLDPALVSLVGETTLSHLQTRPDFAVSVHNALVGFIEIKAPGPAQIRRQAVFEGDIETSGAKLKAPETPMAMRRPSPSASSWRAPSTFR